MDLLEVFTPYLGFTISLITIVVNLFIILRGRTNWGVIIALNIIISVILNIVGWSEYDLLTTIIKSLIGVIESVVKSIVDLINPFTTKYI